MKHRKKNLTLAKTLSVHKLNCALQRKSQLIGSFASDKKSPKLCHRESSSRVLILPQELTFRILTGKQHYHHFQKFGTIKKKLTQKQQKQKPVHLVSNDGNTEHDIDGRKIITLQHSTKQQCQHTQLQVRKTIIFLDRKSMVKSSHQECIVTKPKKKKIFQKSKQLSSYLVMST